MDGNSLIFGHCDVLGRNVDLWTSALRFLPPWQEAGNSTSHGFGDLSGLRDDIGHIMNICFGRAEFHQTNDCTTRSDCTERENWLDFPSRKIHSPRTLSLQLEPDNVDIPVLSRKRARSISPLRLCFNRSDMIPHQWDDGNLHVHNRLISKIDKDQRNCKVQRNGLTVQV